MLKNFLLNHFLKIILKSLKGKKKWLAFIVLVLAYVAQSAGIELDGFVQDVINILNSQEG